MFKANKDLQLIKKGLGFKTGKNIFGEGWCEFEIINSLFQRIGALEKFLGIHFVKEELNGWVNFEGYRKIKKGKK